MVSDVWGVGLTFFMYVQHHNWWLIIVYSIKMLNLFVQTNKINIISQLVKCCNQSTSVEVKKFNIFGVGRI